MNRYIVMVWLVFSSAAFASDLVVTQTGKEVVETFDAFAGTYPSLPAGFTVSSDGQCVVTNSSDFNGVHPGGTREGACLAWDLGDGDRALGYQPTADEFTPGCFMVTVSNATGRAVSRIKVSYEIVCLNNEGRSTSVDLEVSLDGQNYNRIIALSYQSPEALGLNEPAWKTALRSAKVRLPAVIQPGGQIFLRWWSDDAGGAGARDEIGINEVKITLFPPMGTIIRLD